MPQIINVAGHGPVVFPDEMSEEQITAALKKLPLTDDQVIAAAESPDAKVFESKGRDESLELYERYRKLKSKDMSWADKWAKAKDVAA